MHSLLVLLHSLLVSASSFFARAASLFVRFHCGGSVNNPFFSLISVMLQFAMYIWFNLCDLCMLQTSSLCKTYCLVFAIFVSPFFWF